MLAELIAAALIAAPTVVVDRDNIEITESCVLQFVDDPVVDADGNGVVHIRAADAPIVVRCQGRLRGAPPGLLPNEYAGTGISIAGPDVELQDARVSGFKIGIHAARCDRLVVDGADVSDNYRQRLKSTPAGEDSSDWLWPHDNDERQWITRYGAGICIEQSQEIAVRHCRARDVQNGIILDNVNRSIVSDNDCSFLSGWGIALWRSSGNTIRRNALDFCFRGYSHGVYNRGQDSAGLLMFEQCSRNVVVCNSMTHCGDGIFAFAGKEALGEVNPRDDLDWYEARGNNENVLALNDCSYAAAHGIELTFSFDNAIAENRIEGNAICGIWGGYSQRTAILDNRFERNGDSGYGMERGGVNIEHGAENIIAGNEFHNNACGVHLWWDNDEGLLERPWAKANATDARAALITMNRFHGDDIAVQLRRLKSPASLLLNEFEDVGQKVVTEGDAQVERPMDALGADHVEIGNADFDLNKLSERVAASIPENGASPVGARAELAGREHIIMTEWGPYDWTRPLLQRIGVEPNGDAMQAVYRICRGVTAPQQATIVHESPGSDAPRESKSIELNESITEFRLQMHHTGVHRVTLQWNADDGAAQRDVDVLILADWHVRWFNSPCDPREDAGRWRAAANDVEPVHRPQLQLSYAGNGPEADGVGADHFGTIASTTVELPAGRWRLRTTSDDGIRVWMNDELVIDDWTWHAPTQHSHTFALDEPGQVELRVEHFELDGYAVLDVALEPIALH